MKTKENKFLKIIKGVIIGLLILILTLNVCIIIQAKAKPNAVPSIFGYKPFIVLSGSMETAIKVGDLVIVKEVDVSELKVDDIIAFRDSENYVMTHRIIGIVNTEKGKCFETKGDNNNVQDEGTVCLSSIEGKYYSKIPTLGNAILFIQEPLGFAVMMLSIIIICIFIYLASNKKNDVNLSTEELKEFEEFKKNKTKKSK